MRNLMIIGLLIGFLVGCSTSYDSTGSDAAETNLAENDTVRIANDELEYEIIIIEPGFNAWILSQARPRGFYDQKYLEIRNYIWVTEWNIRVLNPYGYDPLLYVLPINYRRDIDYGYEVNYLLYNYFVYFQRKYKQRLGQFTPRI